jgi:LPXTG-motif cell wall-anchored protein
MSRRTRICGWAAAPAVLALVFSSVFVGAAQAAPGNGEGAGQEQAVAHHAQAKEQSAQQSTQATRAEKKRPSAKGRPGAGAQAEHGDTTASQSNAAVRHERPNEFQAQADPDGDDNGGVDQLGGDGGEGGVQDGDNGTGNETDCEDDNRGVGRPGHCDENEPAGSPPGSPPTGSIAPEESENTDASPSADVGEPTTLDDAPIVLGVSAERPDALPEAAEVAGVSAQRDDVAARPLPTVLPATGLAADLALVAGLGVALTVLGGLALRRRRAIEG